MKFAKVPVVGLICLISVLAEGADIGPIYYQEEGRLVLPNLKVGAQSYYVELRQLEGTADF